MAGTYSAGQKQAWSVFAQTWVDTSYDAEDQDRFARDLASTGLSPREIRHIAYWQVCGAFATFSTVVLFTAGMALPDWFYPDDAAQEKVARWLEQPLVLSLLNPFWLAGYVLSVVLLWGTLGSVISAATRRA
jgi:hypothetical protein